MLSSVLHSERAIQTNIAIMRAFVAMRHWILSYDQLQRRLKEMEQRYDGHFRIVFKALRQVLKEESKKKPRIGFV
jgi:nitrate reductase assembly molybdenum cofactor insertion protein NarJ